jgi:hypothetical protein
VVSWVNLDGWDAQAAEMKKELTFAQKEFVMIRNHRHQAEDNIFRELAYRGSKRKKQNSQDDEVGSKRRRHWAVRKLS